ncbi:MULTISPECIES: hypothetical protein [Paenibacillus]|uniref:hypothetical protein n=1 Tax=Paenibacillus TaxID=44249 RepID=UPI000B879BD2|nr:hypothetical protein [Paenibacillus amylolyticus]
MKILTHYEDLVGKTVSFVHAAQFAKAITIATTNNEVIVIDREIDEFGEEGNVRVYPEHIVLEYIKKEDNRYIRNSLAEYAGFDIEEYNKQKKEEEERKRAEWRDKQEKRDREEYERLKQKFNS